MIDFIDIEINELNPESLDDFALLVNKYLCSKISNKKIDENDKKLLTDLIVNAKKGFLNFRQFNEILLLLNQDTVSQDFFQFFFQNEKITLDDLKKGITKFRGIALLCFGNFRFAYNTLRKKNISELENATSPYCQTTEKIVDVFVSRPSKMLPINEIPRNETWFTGYLTMNKTSNEMQRLRQELAEIKDKKNEKRLQELVEFSEQIQNFDEKIKKAQKTAFINTDIYLTWDYMDVYIATSMRNRWEYEETYDFIKKVFNSRILKELNLRYFDPTQSLCGSPRDKGLLEGLMLKRAFCTIYLAQESDTMGKDSELAATLVQKKPVIAYVPKPNLKKYSQKISSYPLDFFKKRFLILNAEEIFDDDTLKSKLTNIDPEYESKISDFLKQLNIYRQRQPYTLWNRKNESFKKEYKNFKLICDLLSTAECYSFDKRADLLKERHPLSMQLDLQSGVANGVLVVRTPEKCAELLYRILTNKMKFLIKHKTENNEILNRTEGFTILEEEISESPFRIVTDNEKLSNTFWNLFF